MFSDLYNGTYNYMNYTPSGNTCEVDLYKINILEGLSDSQKDELLMVELENTDLLYSRIYIFVDNSDPRPSELNWVLQRSAQTTMITKTMMDF